MTMANGRCESDPMAWGGGRGQQPEGRHQHGHHDGPQTADGALHRGFHDGHAARSQLVDVLHHDDADLHRRSEEGQEADSGGDAEVSSGEEQGQHTAGGAMRRFIRIRLAHLDELKTL